MQPYIPLIEGMSDEEFNLDRSNENPNVGKAMQTNTDKIRIYKDLDKDNPRIDRKRDKYGSKEQRKRERNHKLGSREL